METLKSIIEDIIGTYTPVEYLSGEELITAPGMAGVDWPWVISALLFVLCIYSLFRLLGVFFKK